MARFFSVPDLRRALGPDWTDASDEQIISSVAAENGLDATQLARQLGYGDLNAGKWGNRFSAAGDSWQAGMYGVGEAAAGALGAQGAENWFAQQRQDNELAANVSRARAARQGAISSYKDVGGVGDALDFAGGLAVDSSPYFAEFGAGALTGGFSLPATLAKLGLRFGVPAARMIGGAAASYPSAVGDILQNQRETGQPTDFGAAAAGGVPYAALNLLGPETTLARGNLFRNAWRGLDRVGGVGGAAARTAGTVATQGALEGLGEVGQEGINQYFGRMAVDPNETFWNPASQERFAESFVGGAVLGGAIGGALGGWRRGQFDVDQPNANLLDSGSTAPPAAPAPPGMQQVETRYPGGLPSEMEAWQRYQQEQDMLDAYDLLQGQTGDTQRNPEWMRGVDMAERAMLSPQPDLFNYYNDRSQYSPSSETWSTDYRPEYAAPPADNYTGDLFDAAPTAGVRTDFSQQQVLRELRQANPQAKVDGFTVKLANTLSQLADDPQAAEEYIVQEQENLYASKASIKTTDARQRTLDAAVAVVDRLKQRTLDAQAQEGAARGQPGATNAVGPNMPAVGSEQDIRARNAAVAQREGTAAVDARVAASRAPEIDRLRQNTLDAILRDPNTVNPRGRFTARLKNLGIKDTALRPSEVARIDRWTEAKGAFTEPGQGELNLGVVTPGVTTDTVAPATAAPAQPNPNQGDLFNNEVTNAVQEQSPAAEAAAPEAAAAEIPAAEISAAESPAAPAGSKPGKVKPVRAYSEYDGVSVSIPTQSGGKAGEMRVPDVGKRLRELESKANKYRAFIACLS